MHRDQPPRFLVLFPDDWAAYSPTLTRLVERLGRLESVAAFILDTGRFPLDGLAPPVYRRVRTPGRAAAALRKLGLWRIARVLLLAWSARRELRPGAQVIAIDADGAWAATLMGAKFHLVSLEIDRFSSVRWLVRRRCLSICIQTAERLEHQFPKGEASALPVFYLPNAPALTRPPEPRTKANSPARMVYMGNLIPAHGVEQMVSLLASAAGPSLVLHGPISPAYKSRLEEKYSALVSAGRLAFSSGFIEDDGIRDFLAGFDVGLCLYDTSGRLAGDFNYLSSPSGKMFNYFAAAMPVLASPVPGLSPVTRFRAGVQAASNSGPDLARGLDRILASYAEFSDGAAKAAIAFDFDTAFQAYADHLRGVGDG